MVSGNSSTVLLRKVPPPAKRTAAVTQKVSVLIFPASETSKLIQVCWGCGGKCRSQFRKWYEVQLLLLPKLIRSQHMTTFRVKIWIYLLVNVFAYSRGEQHFYTRENTLLTDFLRSPPPLLESYSIVLILTGTRWNKLRNTTYNKQISLHSFAFIFTFLPSVKYTFKTLSLFRIFHKIFRNPGHESLILTSFLELCVKVDFQE